MNAIKKTNSKRKATAKLIPLRVVYSKKETQKLINGLWTVAYSSLWHNRTFCTNEVQELKTLLADHFKNKRSDKQNFKELVERICLAKRYVARKKGRYISKPIDYLNINYKNGLVGTASWLKVVNEQRKSVPHYNEGISTLANAMLKFIEAPKDYVYYRFKAKLIEQKQYDLLQIFQNVIINLQYFN
jgi:hypothetical protein